MKNIKIILCTAILAALTSCVTDDDYNTPDLSNECVTITANVAIEDVVNNATTTPTLWDVATNGSVLEAYVTSSDEGGNFYKSISMVAYDQNNNQVGFTVPINEYNLFNLYEPGRKVYIDMKDLYFAFDSWTADYGIGELLENDIANPSDDEIGRIALESYKNKVFRSCEKVDEETLIHRVSNISEVANDSYIHKLIEFEDVQFRSDFVGKTYFDTNNTAGSGTNITIEDKFGNVIDVRASQYAKFAGDIIPGGNGKIRGVLTKYGSGYQFMIRTINDVKIDNDRYVPTILFEETFETSTFTNWTAYSVIGAQVWNTTTFGNPAPSAIMNGYSSGNQNNEDWLISPAIDLSSNTFAILTFDTSTRFTGPALEAYISTNYDGTSAPSTATWTQLTGFNLPVYTSGGFTSWSAGASGGINITAYIGNPNVRVAYKYTSTTSGAAAWEVDNVKIVGQ